MADPPSSPTVSLAEQSVVAVSPPSPADSLVEQSVVVVSPPSPAASLVEQSAVADSPSSPTVSLAEQSADDVPGPTMAGGKRLPMARGGKRPPMARGKLPRGKRWSPGGDAPSPKRRRRSSVSPPASPSPPSSPTPSASSGSSFAPPGSPSDSADSDDPPDPPAGAEPPNPPDDADPPSPPDDADPSDSASPSAAASSGSCFSPTGTSPESAAEDPLPPRSSPEAADQPIDNLDDVPMYIRGVVELIRSLPVKADGLPSRNLLRRDVRLADEVSRKTGGLKMGHRGGRLRAWAPDARLFSQVEWTWLLADELRRGG